MLKIEKHTDIKGGKARTISRAITDVIKEFEKRAKVTKIKKLDIYVTVKPVETAQKILWENAKIKRHGEIREWITETAPSFSYWVKGKTPVIMLNAKEDIFKKMNYPAIKGLFAHELMHILNKLDGIEDELEDEAEKAGRNILKHLGKHKEVKPFTRERLLVSMIRVTTTTLLYLKDILANSRAMSFGFDENLFENYRISLADAQEIEYTENDIIKALKEDRKHYLDNAFLVYVGLNVSWVTFKMFQNIWYLELQKLAKIKVPKIIKTNGDKILKEMLHLRSGHDEEQIAKILKIGQECYHNVVQYFCKKLGE